MTAPLTPPSYSNTQQKPRRFLIGLVIGLGSAFLANLIPYGWTCRAYDGDGFEVIGFPFTFRLVGGLSYRYWFSTTKLYQDIAIGIAFAILFALAWRFSRFIQSKLPTKRDLLW